MTSRLPWMTVSTLRAIRSKCCPKMSIPLESVSTKAFFLRIGALEL